MSIVIGPGIVIGAGIFIGLGEAPVQPIMLLITEAGLDLQTEVGDDITTESKHGKYTNITTHKPVNNDRFGNYSCCSVGLYTANFRGKLKKLLYR